MSNLKPTPVQRLGKPSFPSPLRLEAGHGHATCQFVTDATWIRYNCEVRLNQPAADELLFERAGPRDRLFFDAQQTRAAIVTCGGLCPGLNDVIRSLFLELHFNYGVRSVLGIRYGYAGFSPMTAHLPVELTCECVGQIHTLGGTILGSSRGEQEPAVMVDTLVRERIDMLFCVGGDGTQRGAHAICNEIERRGLSIAVVGIPKTIDNDIPYCDRTFGMVTAVDAAQKVLEIAHTEARGAQRGIGLVKLMGREAGFIACFATLASQDVNFTLIPELPFVLEGESGFLAVLRKRMNERSHALIAVAEGAGQDLFPREMQGTDASGNRRYHDIGPFLKDCIVAYFKQVGEPVEIKYIDPSYVIRGVPANCDDSLLCDQLARHAAHAAMSGRTNVLICLKNGKFMHVPIPLVVGEKRRVDIGGDLWSAVLAATGQPATFGN